MHHPCMPYMTPVQLCKDATLLVQCAMAFGKWKTYVPEQIIQQLLSHKAAGILRSNSANTGNAHDLISAGKLTKLCLAPSAC